ncbi:AAA family ATPase [Streptomyces xanthochromogenes]|uniref:AAA family ATPase n=1 Tax=Streptomyces xanthochromogenes TaxID=67384 RepID=UPI0037A6EA32
MRLHTLHLQAFGPFAGQHTIDFDSLSADGTFLLYGDTGAGKSTVFAAICFALYGKPPGERNQRLRSDHAPADLLTEVTLDVTLAGKRLRIRRIPAQHRPKRHGEGTTLQKAETYLSEWAHESGTSGGWEPLGKSHQEAAAEVELLLGMSRQQFCQVVLLPQNEFTKFLRADALDRKDLLGRLFGTGRFASIEEWLASRKSTVAKTRDEARADVLRLAERIQQAAGDDLNPGRGAPRPDVPATLTEPARAWAVALHTAAAHHHKTAAADAGSAHSELRAFREQERAVRELAARQTAHRTARHGLDLLDEQADHHHELTQRRQLALIAQKLAPLLHAAATAATQHTRAQDEEHATRTLLSAEHRVLNTQRLTATSQQLRADIGALRALLPDEATLQQHTARLQKLDAERRQVEEDLADAESWLADAPTRRSDLLARREQARTAQVEGRELGVALTQLTGRLEAARRRDTCEKTVRDTEDRLNTLRAATEEAGLAYLAIRRRRTDGMAAELAGGLTDGEPCPVCGSPVHPAPAAPHPDQPTAADEQQAEEHYTHAQQQQKTIEDTLRELGEQAATARGQAGGDTPTADLTADHENLKRRLAEALEHASDAGPAEEQLQLLEREFTETEQVRADTAARLAATHTAYDSLDAQRHTLDQRLAAARADAPTLTDRITQLTDTADRLETAATRAAATTRIGEEHHKTARTAAEASRTAGFASADAAAQALLSDSELHTLDDEINQWRQQRAVLTARLEETDLTTAAAQPPADVDEATAHLEAATTRHTRAAALAEQAADRTRALADLTTQLDTLTQRLQPLEDAYRTVDHLHGLINGTSLSNQLRMQLEAYVLAARLEDVVAAANTRLLRMSDHRYTLAHSDARAARGARSGLGLKILDAWTGRERDTDTLSGGESFFASLALALGLADIVTAEAGGRALDTLFIDEGFGTLDEDTLHQVLDVLDTLRAHDRTVGLISHVPELRRRITHRLHVRKHTTGSTLAQLTAAAE